MRTRFAILGTVTILACVVGWPLAVAIGSPLPVRSTSASRPTLTQLEADIAASAKIRKAPDLTKTIPPLSSLTPADETLPMSSPCYSLGEIPFPAQPASKCEWGDLHAHRTIFLFGDSQAAMWLPSFASLGNDLGWRVVLLAKAGCPPWEYKTAKNYSLGDGLDQFSCRKFVAEEVGFATKSHPQVVIPIGDDSTTGYGLYAGVPQYETELSLLLQQLKASKARILLLSQFPQYFAAMTPTTCLTVYGNDVTACSLNPDTITGRAISLALSEVSQSSGTPLINVMPLFCTSKLCPLFVKGNGGTYLIHVEMYHMNRIYAAWISRALGQLIGSHL